MTDEDGAVGAADGVAGTVVELPDAESCRDYGRELARLLRAGDLLVLTGPLGAGKTTLTQGIGQGLEVRGQVASPTFIIARVHPSLVGGPALVHVDAYRLGSLDELDALDLDASLEDSVTVVEWGEGLAEVLSEDRLELVLERPHGGAAAPVPADGDAAPGQVVVDEVGLLDAEAGTRRLTVRGVGDRWAGVTLPLPG